jgi:16S rRNA (adenine1518-N6/adenine1519-N6)-dimethyltransferase
LHSKGDARLRPKKSLGQNFLRDHNIARNVIAAFRPQPDDLVLEIGPGEGILTSLLAGRVRRLVAMDIDRRVVERLRGVYPAAVEIVHQDILTADFALLSRAAGGPVRIIGNIPYNITTPILFHLLDQRKAVSDALIMMQREVARRLVAGPGTKEYGIPSVFFRVLSDVEIVFDVSAEAFFPRPKVTSSLVRLKPLPSPRYGVEDELFFRRMVRFVFGQRRKTLRNSLRAFLQGEGAELPGVDGLERRPEELTAAEHVALANRIYRVAGPRNGVYPESRGS